MKLFAELTDQELTALTDEQVADYHDFACAQRGIPLLPAVPPVPPEIESPEPDVEVYSIGGFDFTTQAAALAVASVVGAQGSAYIGLGYGRDYRDKIVRSVVNQPINISTSRAFSRTRYDEVAEMLDVRRKTQEEYETAKKEYDDAVASRQEIVGEINDRINEAWRRQRQRASLRTQFARYLTLAGGDAEIARKFLQNAHADAPELLPDLWPTEVGAGF